MAGTSLGKALSILEALENERGSASLGEVARATGVTKPTAHRMLALLEERGYVRRLPNRDYALGPRLIALGDHARRRNSLVTVAGPVLDRLVTQCNETIHLGVVSGRSLLYVDRREPADDAVRLGVLPAPLTSLHASAAGKVLLAFGPDALLEQVIDSGLPRYTAHTITSSDELRAELRQVSAQGYALNEQERNEGIRAVAVPVLTADGRCPAALSAAGPIWRLTLDGLDRARTLLARGAAEIAAADVF
ncbi:IclR family transcriptional regulator [Polymorphospora sp. NPDC050346]|uniref:IclR family transcriptional regulator n=1 Tax=Polymorphospora sp. NPDC050346 TaxID=3155780 RepID=UPI003401AF53